MTVSGWVREVSLGWMAFELGIKGLVVIVQEEKNYTLKEFIPGITCNLVELNHRVHVGGGTGEKAQMVVWGLRVVFTLLKHLDILRSI